MKSLRCSLAMFVLLLICGVNTARSAGLATWPLRQEQNAPAEKTTVDDPPIPPQAQTSASVPTLPRGKKLILKDGSSEVVRSYSVEGDRVRYYSVERSQWEEIPYALVDWDATKRAAEAEAAVQAKEMARVEELAREHTATAASPDVDASYEVAPGVFLPPGEGLFVLGGKTPLQLKPSDATLKTDKRRAAEKIFVPLPIVPSRRFVELKGAQAETRIHDQNPEFYLRTTADEQPDLQLLQVLVRGNTRVIENLETLVGQQKIDKKTLPLQAWEAAKGLYRYTLSAPLPPGEYALIEPPKNNQDIDLTVWDFGVDAAKSKD